MIFILPDYVDFPSWGGQSGHRLEVMPQSKFSGVSGCSDAAVSQGSVCGTPTPSDIVIGKTTKNHNLQECMFFKTSSAFHLLYTKKVIVALSKITFFFPYFLNTAVKCV